MSWHAPCVCDRVLRLRLPYPRRRTPRLPRPRDRVLAAWAFSRLSPNPLTELPGFRRLHFLEGRGLWQLQSSTHRKCWSARSGWCSTTKTRMTPSGRPFDPWRRRSAARWKRFATGYAGVERDAGLECARGPGGVTPRQREAGPGAPRREDRSHGWPPVGGLGAAWPGTGQLHPPRATCGNCATRKKQAQYTGRESLD